MPPLGLVMADGLALHDPPQQRTWLLRALRRNEHLEAAADRLLRGESEQALGPRVPARDGAVERVGDDGVLRRFDSGAEQALTIAGAAVLLDLALERGGLIAHFAG